VNIAFGTTSSHTIQRAKLRLDGRDVALVEAPGGTGPVSLEAHVNGLSRGPPTLEVVVPQQASFPNEYFASGSVSTPDRILDLAIFKKVLATGEALEIRSIL
jgi:hypothetical protein